MAKERTYRGLQDEAELLGIRQNQSAEELQKAIADATSPEAVGALMELNQNLGEAAEAVRTDMPADIDGVIGKITELHEAQLADKEVHTEPYLTGIANGLLMAIGAVRNIDVTEQLLKPITQVAIKGAKVLTGRQRLINVASKFITRAGGTYHLRSGLTPAQITEADDIMKRLGVKVGVYTIPVE